MLSLKYCGIECQKAHRKQHKRACNKRAAELRDELLFKQPETTHLGDCPICCVPMSLDPTKSAMNTCCSKIICIGCVHANKIREDEARLVQSCPFCRDALPLTEEEDERKRMKRIEANDPVAMCKKGAKHCLKKEYPCAFGYFVKAAELGDAEAHYKLSVMYREGDAVDKDEGKSIHHLEEAVIAGHPSARHDLACHHWNKNNNAERAVKHLIIAATQGDNRSIKSLMNMFKGGHVSKADLDAALRAHKAAVDATKSPQREAAELAG